MNNAQPSKAIVSKFEKKVNEIKTDLKRDFQNLANFMNNKYESTSGQIYFKMDVINKELEELRKAIIQLGDEFNSGLVLIHEELNLLKPHILEVDFAKKK